MQTRETIHDRPTQVPDSAPGCAGLVPWTIVALGTPTRPIERAIGLQAAVYRLIVFLGDIRLPRRRPAEARRADAALAGR